MTYTLNLTKLGKPVATFTAEEIISLLNDNHREERKFISAIRNLIAHGEKYSHHAHDLLYGAWGQIARNGRRW